MFAAAAMALLLAQAPTPADIAPIRCDACDDWNAPQAPFKLHGNSYYIGTKGVSAVVVDTGGGLVLLDGGLPQSAPRIVENLRAIGKRIEDVRWIGISHAHFDHVGGVAALARMSGAQVAATRSAAAVLRAGIVGPDDPQAGFGEAMRFPTVAKVTVLRDRGTIRLGVVTFTMHHTPGHTPGGTSWSWRSCEGERCLDLVYADSLNAVSAPGFRFSGDRQRVKEFRRTIARVRALPCDILVGAHPSFSRLFERLAARATDPDALVDRAGCRRYADEAEQRLEARLADEQAPAAPPR